MQKLFSILFCVILGVSSLSAQGKETLSWRKNLKFGVVGGINLTQLENYGGGPFYFFDYAPSWKAGIAAQYKWDGFISIAIQPELRYNKVITEIEPVIGQTYGKTELHMIDLPVNFQLGLQLSPIFRPFISIGLTPAAIVAKNGILLDWEGVSPLSTLNMSWTAGIGFELWRFQARFEYTRGLTDLNKYYRDPDWDFEHLKLGGFDFSLGIFF